MTFIVAGSVRLVTEYEQVLSDLTRAFREETKKPWDRVRMVGLLFARPALKLANEQILPNLAYLHYRSGKLVNFYCGGYWKGKQKPDPEEGRLQVAEGWMYSDRAFDCFREDIQKRTTWRYSGGVDLILTNAHYRPKPRSILQAFVESLSPPREVSLDFSSSISVNLETLKKEGAIESVPMFFENIIRYAETQDGDDPTWGFSDAMGIRVVGSALKSVVVSLLPKPLQDDAKRAAHFAITDIGRPPAARSETKPTL